MILPGRVAYARGILSNIRCVKTQIQPCGIDLSLKHVMTLQSPGCVDFDNTRRQVSASTLLPYEPIDTKDQCLGDSESNENTDQSRRFSIHLKRGVYLVEFNELIHTPLDVMGQIFVRSSLFRSGANVHAGVMDSGYEGVIGAMLTVENPAGLRLYKNARLAQMVLHLLSEPTHSYNGQYQGRKSL